MSYDATNEIYETKGAEEVSLETKTEDLFDASLMNLGERKEDVLPKDIG